MLFSPIFAPRWIWRILQFIKKIFEFKGLGGKSLKFGEKTFIFALKMHAQMHIAVFLSLCLKFAWV